MAAATAYGSFAKNAGAFGRGGQTSDVRSLEWARSRQITPSTASSQPRQWSSTLTGFRQGRGVDTRFRRSKSQTMFRPPTSMFAQQGVESAARLPAIRTPGGFHATSFDASVDMARSTVSVASASTGALAVGNSTVGGASSSTARWPVGNRGSSKSLPPSFGSRSVPSGTLSSFRDLDGTGNEHMLRTLSSAAQEENMRRTHSFELLDGLPRNAEEAIEARAARYQKRREATGRGRCPTDIEVVHDFEKVSSQIISRASELRHRLDGFVPGAATKAVQDAGAKGSGHSKVSKCEYQEDKASRVERFEAYKMVRKIEPELPPLAPLQRDSSLPPPPKKDSDVIERNTSFEAIAVWLPEKRRKRMQYLKEIRESKMKSAAEQCQALQAQKLHQIRKNIDDRAEEAVQVGRERRKQFAEQWLTMVALASFASRAHEEVNLHRMSSVQLLQYVSKNKSKLEHMSGGHESECVRHALEVDASLKNPAVQARFGMVTKMFLRRKAVRKKREEVSVIWKAMSEWRHSGRVMKTLLSYRYNVSKIQVWWRQCRKRLHEQRDHVARRWKNLERAELLAEQEKAAKPEKLPQTLRSCSLKMTDRHRNLPLPVMDEPTRTLFIENELRARRFLLLPQIERWQEDRKAWKRNVDDWSSSCQALNLMGQSTKNASLFRWPPARPSFMPPVHFRDEDQGKPCLESCPGRQGDLQILDMWKRARKNPENYTRIPDKRTKRASMMLTASPEDEAAEASAQVSIYGPPPSTAEVNRFGAEMDMPGIHLQNQAQAPHMFHDRSRTESTNS